ncbi:MAG: ferredoxin [Planctomycetes bacterium]|nr:ferredoxin [Planctomycetota bacterium]
MASSTTVRTLTIEEGCIACSLCAQLVPEVFLVVDGVSSQVLDGWLSFVESDPGADERLLGARDSCPVDVIRVELG